MKKLLIIVFIASTLYGQADSNFCFTAKVIAGVTFPGLTSYPFLHNSYHVWSLEKDFYSVYPDLAYGVSIESPNVINIYNANLNFAIEAIYGSASTDKVDSYYAINIDDYSPVYEKIQYCESSIPVMFWLQLKTEGIIVPYIKLGIGAERKEMKEEYELSNRYDFDIKEWFFAYGIGAGFEINCFEQFPISLFVESIIREKGIQKRFDDGSEINYNFRNGVIFAGVQIGYRI